MKKSKLLFSVYSPYYNDRNVEDIDSSLINITTTENVWLTYLLSLPNVLHVFKLLTNLIHFNKLSNVLSYE